MIEHQVSTRILLVEDDPGDVLILTEVLGQDSGRRTIDVVSDGENALDYLRRRGAHTGATRPHLIVLDLNLPRIDGRQVLSEVKQDPDLRSVPVVVLSTSDADIDVTTSYNLHANAYVVKPVDYEEFARVVRRIDDFFLNVARLPPSAH